MKRVGKVCLCLAGGLVLSAGLRAAETLSPNNPYAPIVTRNVFDIHPPPPPKDTSKEQAEAQLPKITVNGIISNLGRWQALFKVPVPPKPPIPAREQTYILGEGEGQDDIEVVKIDEKAGLVTFKNHGMEQEIPLANATASSSPPPALAGPAPTIGPRPGFPRPGFVPPAGNVNPGGGRFGLPSGPSVQNPNANNSGANPNSRMGVTMGGAGGFGQQPNAQPQSLSADDQAVVIAAKHAIAEQQGDPIARIFPPTDYDQDAGATPNVAGPATPGGVTP